MTAAELLALIAAALLLQLAAGNRTYCHRATSRLYRDVELVALETGRSALRRSRGSYLD